MMRTQARLYLRYLIGGIVVALALHLLGLAGIFYVRPVENDPYKNGVAVTEVNADHLTFSDGRVFRPIGGLSERSRKIIQESASRVDIEIDDTNLVTIYGRQRVFVCGFGMPMIVLPIIPINVPKYNKTTLEIGEVDGLPRGTNARSCPEREQCGSETVDE